MIERYDAPALPAGFGYVDGRYCESPHHIGTTGNGHFAAPLCGAESSYITKKPTRPNRCKRCEKSYAKLQRDALRDTATCNNCGTVLKMARSMNGRNMYVVDEHACKGKRNA